MTKVAYMVPLVTTQIPAIRQPVLRGSRRPA